MPRFWSYTSENAANPLLGPGSGVVGQTMQTDTAQNIVGSIYTNQAGTAYVEQTPDGINWDVSKSITVASGIQNFIEPVIWPQVRVRYVNGGSQQTGSFRLAARVSQTGVD